MLSNCWILFAIDISWTVTQTKTLRALSQANELTDRLKILRAIRPQNRSFQGRSSDPTTQHGAEETKPNTTRTDL